MRRLTDVVVTSSDRPAPPRRKPAAARAQTAPAAAPEAPAKPPRRRRAAPTWWKRTRVALVATAGLAVLVGGPAWLIHSGTWARLSTQMGTQASNVSARWGLRVESIQVEGRKRIATDALLAALGIERGQPIFGVDLEAAQARLAALPGVKSVTLERRLPGELHVLIAEREPVAVWQIDGHYKLIDREGQAAGDNIADFPNLPLVVGDGAPAHTADLLSMLATEQGLAARIQASQWVSGERWSISFNGPAGTIEVRLPGDDPASAWHDLAKLEAEQKLLERKVTVIDMRQPDRLVLRVPGGIAPTPATKADGRHKAPGRDA